MSRRRRRLLLMTTFLRYLMVSVVENISDILPVAIYTYTSPVYCALLSSGVRYVNKRSDL